MKTYFRKLLKYKKMFQQNKNIVKKFVEGFTLL